MTRLFQALTAVLLLTLSVQPGLAAEDGKSDVPSPDAKKPVPAKQPGRILVRPQALVAVPNMRVTREPTTLLRNSQVQEDLKLDVAQQDKIRDIYQQQNAKRTEQFQAIRGLQGEERKKKIAERRKQMETAAKETRQKLRQLLKPEQQTRLDQIALQMQGQRVWQDQAIIKKLKISDQQQQQFKGIEQSALDKRKQLFQDLRAGNLDRTKYSEKLKEISKGQEAKSENVLSKEQREHFQKLKGEKFEMRAQVIRRGPVALPAANGQPRKIQLQPRKIQLQPLPQGKLQKVPLQPQKIKAK
jgi:hypothetical protein